MTTEPKNQLSTRKKGLREFLSRMAPEIQQVATRHLDAETLASLVYTEAARVPDILNCVAENPSSVASTVMLAASLGLDVSSPLGHFYLIPRRMKADPRNKGRNAPKRWTLSYIVGYKGLLELARRSDQIVRLNAGVVFDGELPENGGSFHWSDEPPECRHPKHWKLEKNDADLVAAYAIAVLPGGARVQLLLDRDELDDRRSRAQSDTFWRRDFAAMARKSAIRALLNGGLVPLTPALSRALEAETEDRVEVIEVESVPAPAPRARAADPLRGALGLDVVDATEDPLENQVEEPLQAAEGEPPSKIQLAELSDLDAILALEDELSSERINTAVKKAKINPEAELEGQDPKKLEAYRKQLEKFFAELEKRSSK
jgi:recombination protein RecT